MSINPLKLKFISFALLCFVLSSVITPVRAKTLENHFQDSFEKITSLRYINIDSSRLLSHTLMDSCASSGHDSLYIVLLLDELEYDLRFRKSLSNTLHSLDSLEATLTENKSFDFFVYKARFLRGKCYEKMGRFALALDHYYQCLAYFEKHHSKAYVHPELADLYRKLYVIYSTTISDYKTAADYVDLLGQRYISTGSLYYGVIHYSLLSQQYIDKNKLDKARDAAFESLKLARNIDNIQFMLMGYHSVVGYFIQIKDYDQALAYIADIYSKVDSKYHSSSIFGGLITLNGHIYDQKGDFETSMEYNRRALHLREKSRDSVAIISSMLNISNDFINLKRYQEAIDILDSVFIQINNLDFHLYYDRYYRFSIKAYMGNEQYKDAADIAVQYLAFKDTILDYMSSQRVDIYKHRSMVDQYTRENVEKELRHREEVSLYQIITIISLSLIVSFVIILLIRKRNENRLMMEQKVLLQKSKEIAEQADKMKSAFLANMSHEIRTPLNAIIGFSNILSESNIALTDERREEFKNIIKENSDYLLDLINNILDLSKLEADGVNISPISHSPQALLDDVLMVSKSNLKKDLILTVDNHFALEDKMYSYDPLRVKQVLLILITNAIKFTETGYVKFGVYSVSNFYLKFYVTDTGKGIKKEDQDYIFDRFHQGGNGQIESVAYSKGSGLGLSIAKGLVEAMNGEIEVQSELNVGSTFIFSIKL